MPVRYPCWRYHATQAAKIVHSAEQERQLGNGWANNFAVFGRDTENAPATELPEAEPIEPAAPKWNGKRKGGKP